MGKRGRGGQSIFGESKLDAHVGAVVCGHLESFFSSRRRWNSSAVDHIFIVKHYDTLYSGVKKSCIS